jgi:hypothetical protein
MSDNIASQKLQALAAIPGALNIPARDLRENKTQYVVLVPVESVEPIERGLWRATGTYKGKSAATEGTPEALCEVLQKKWAASELDPNGTSTGRPTVAPAK